MNILDETEVLKLPRGNYHEWLKDDPEYKYKAGVYYYPKGIVDVMADKQMISLSFCFDGIMYRRSIKNFGSTSKNSISLKCNAFIKSILDA
jgi:hypothetical protein